MSTDGVDIARSLRERRRALGLTRERLADRTGISTRDLSRWERGEQLPTPEAVLSLAEAIELDVAETQMWLDEIEWTGSGDADDPRESATRSSAGLLDRIADRLAALDETRAAAGGAPVTPIREPAPSRPAPSTTRGLVRSPAPSQQLPSIFPEPRLAPYDPAVLVYSAGPLREQSEEERRMYLLRRVRTASILIGLGFLLWWSAGSLWEGLGDAVDLFRSPGSGG